MKKIFLSICLALVAFSIASAADLTGKRIYINPGHGSFGPNDRPMATIPFPNLATTGMPDTCGFYESNTNLWKCFELGRKLEAAGATVMYSRTQNGPWPYVYPYTEYIDSVYKKLPDYEKYNRNLSEICEEVEANNMDFYISVHSNAATEATSTNYPLILYRGNDDGTTNVAGDSRLRAQKLWPFLFEAMASGIDPFSYYSVSSQNVRGDISFYGSSSSRTVEASGKTYTGFLAALKHGCPGYLSEGYFHTYQPARHRALNRDYCRQEGVRYYRGIVDYYGAPTETTGYIMGTVKDLHEKMDHPLFTYSAKTNDQWIPCNGAIVKLYKAGAEIASYTVDNNYNGLFVFENLAPGSDYSLDITCEGYKPLAAEYKTPITVKANATTYPMVFLESTSYIPPEIAYVDYPDPVQPAYLKLPTKINFTQNAKKTYEITGVIKRTLACGDSTIVLSHSADGTPHLYLIDNKTQLISSLSTTGIIAKDPENLGDYLQLSDVALTCDGKLLGINYTRCQYSSAQLDAGYKMGVIHIYKWDNLNANPTDWLQINTKPALSGNFNRSDTGKSMTVSGPSTDCTITTTAVTSSTSRQMRFTQIAIADGAVVSTSYSKPATATDCSEITQGERFLLQLSPLENKQNFILDGELSTPIEIKVPGTTNEIKGQIPATVFGNVPSETNFFRYAGKSLLVSPSVNAEKKVDGVCLIDVTDGLNNAAVVKVLNGAIAEPVVATFAAATAKVEGADITIYLMVDGDVYTFTTKGAEQPVVKGIYAYDLRQSISETTYTFTFKANEQPTECEIVFYKEGTEVGRVACDNPVVGENSVVLTQAQLPGVEGDVMTWAVAITSDAIATISPIFTQATGTYTGRMFNTVDNSPESDYFGRIYVMHRYGSNKPENAAYVYDQTYTRLNSEGYKGGQTWGNPTRPSIDYLGRVYFADWGDGHPGLYVADPADMTKNFTPFFKGTFNSEGLITNNGKEIGSSTPGCFIYGTGKDTRLFMYNEDQGSRLPKNGVVVYNIGQADGSIPATWGVQPDNIYPLTGQTNTEGNVWATTHGFFVSQNRTKGNNNTSATSLKFYDYDGNQQFSSALEPYNEIILGSDGGGYAVSKDEKTLILNGGDKQFQVFDITWEGDKPVLTLNYEFVHGQTIRQMNFDYAGNLVASGDGGYLCVFTMPNDNNSCTVPAKSTFTVVKGNTQVGVKNITEMNVFYCNGVIYNPNNLNLKVYNMQGQLVATGSENISVENIVRGAYIVKSEQSFVKFIK